MIKDIVEKIVATQTLEDLYNLIDWLNAETFYARFTQAEKSLYPNCHKRALRAY